MNSSARHELARIQADEEFFDPYSRSRERRRERRPPKQPSSSRKRTRKGTSFVGKEERTSGPSSRSVSKIMEEYGCGRLTGAAAIAELKICDLEGLFHQTLDREGSDDLSTIRHPFQAASPGAATGRVFLSMSEAMASYAKSRDEKKIFQGILVIDVLLPCQWGSLQYLSGLILFGSSTASHVAVFAKSLGLPCLVSSSPLFSPVKKAEFSDDVVAMRIGDEEVRKGEWLTIGLRGEAYLHRGRGTLTSHLVPVTLAAHLTNLFFDNRD